MVWGVLCSRYLTATLLKAPHHDTANLHVTLVGSSRAVPLPLSQWVGWLIPVTFPVRGLKINNGSVLIALFSSHWTYYFGNVHNAIHFQRELELVLLLLARLIIKTLEILLEPWIDVAEPLQIFLVFWVCSVMQKFWGCLGPLHQREAGAAFKLGSTKELRRKDIKWSFSFRVQYQVLGEDIWFKTLTEWPFHFPCWVFVTCRLWLRCDTRSWSWTTRGWPVWVPAMDRTPPRPAGCCSRGKAWCCWWCSAEQSTARVISEKTVEIKFRFRSGFNTWDRSLNGAILEDFKFKNRYNQT